MTSEHKKRQIIEKELGTKLPNQANGLHFFQKETFPGSDLDLKTVYIKFQISRETYLYFIKQDLEAELIDNLDGGLHTWPDDWSGPSDLDWWDISFESTQDVAVTLPGKTRIRTKYEGGYAYIKLLK